MLAVCFDIRNIVDDVNDAGDQAEQGESAQGARKSRPVKKLFIEDERKKDESIFRPLARTHGFEQGANHELILPCVSGNE